MYHHAKSFVTPDRIQLIVKNAYQLSQDANAGEMFSLFKCFQYLKGIHPNKPIHVLVDEYDEEEMTISEAVLMKRILSNSIEYKNSTIAISVQSVGKHRRTYREEEPSGIESKGGYWESTGMKTYLMKHTMRSTTKISDVVEDFQSGISQEQNIVYLPDKPSTRYTSDDITHTQPKTNVTILPSDQDEISTTPHVATASTEVKMTKSVVRLEPNLDTLIKQSKPSPPSSSRLESSFHFIQSMPGHKIEGQKPKLFRHRDKQRLTKKSIAQVEYFVKKVCFKKGKRKALFICNDDHIMQAFVKVFDQIDVKAMHYYHSISSGLPPSPEEQTKVYDTLYSKKENILLLTDIRGCRGLEFEKV